MFDDANQSSGANNKSSSQEEEDEKTNDEETKSPPQASAFLALPRELRDLIYTQVLLRSHPTPSPASTAKAALWFRPTFSSVSGLDNRSYAASRARAPGTCANMLCVSKQIHAEMAYILDRERKRGTTGLKLDCMLKDGVHWFSWLSIPIVRTEGWKVEKQPEVKNWAAKLLPAAATEGLGVRGDVTTVIEKLSIDVRICDVGRGQDDATERGKTSWAICAALQHVLEFGPDIRPAVPLGNGLSRKILIEDLVLNVLPSSSSPESSSNSTATTTSPTDAHLLAKELLDAWHRLWGAWQMPAQYYKHLLEKIEQVRVCVDGNVVGTRVLRRELERGRREMGRVERRMG